MQLLKIIINTEKIRERSNATLKNNYKLGLTKSSFSGKTHSDETKEKISKSRSKHLLNRKTGICQYYTVFCPYQDRYVQVQGTWELFTAMYMNEHNILWVKDYDLHYFHYIIPNETHRRTYYPDFYLPEHDLYIEVKGSFRNKKHSSIDSIEKTNLVQKYNPDAKISYLFKKDIIEMGYDKKTDYTTYLSQK